MLPKVPICSKLSKGTCGNSRFIHREILIKTAHQEAVEVVHVPVVHVERRHDGVQEAGGLARARHILVAWIRGDLLAAEGVARLLHALLTHLLRARARVRVGSGWPPPCPVVSHLGEHRAGLGAAGGLELGIGLG